MSVPHPDHAVRTLYSRRFQKRVPSQWQASEEADATHLVIEIRHGAGYTTDLTFEWPAQKYESDRLERMLELAHDYGDARALARVRKVLGIR